MISESLKRHEASHLHDQILLLVPHPSIYSLSPVSSTLESVIKEKYTPKTGAKEVTFHADPTAQPPGAVNIPIVEIPEDSGTDYTPSAPHSIPPTASSTNSTVPASQPRAKRETSAERKRRLLF